MARIPDAFIDDLLARTDIVEVINARVPLKRQGKEYSARCPFHDERSPSFTVSPTKQFYHCFGCGAHGTAISFLMQYDRLEFLDAVDELARQAGMSRSVFAAAFRDTVGSTPGQYLQEWRIGLAQQALRRGRPLKAVAADVGYGSEAALSRAFKAQTGRSPREWKKAAEAVQDASQVRADAVGVVRRPRPGANSPVGGPLRSARASNPGASRLSR